MFLIAHYVEKGIERKWWAWNLTHNAKKEEITMQILIRIEIWQLISLSVLQWSVVPASNLMAIQTGWLAVFEFDFYNIDKIKSKRKR